MILLKNVVFVEGGFCHVLSEALMEHIKVIADMNFHWVFFFVKA